MEQMQIWLAEKSNIIQFYQKKKMEEVRKIREGDEFTEEVKKKIEEEKEREL